MRLRHLGGWMARAYVLVVLSLIVWLFACPALAGNDAWLIPSEARFRPEGIVVIEEREVKSHGATISQTELGVYNEVEYYFYFTDGGGTFAGAPGNIVNGTQDSRKNEENWRAHCRKDPMNDDKMCYMKIKNLWIFVHPQRPSSVHIGHDHYPGSSVTIRINNDKPFTTMGTKQSSSFDAKTSAMIIAKLQSNPKIVTRYQEWPNSYPTDESWQVFGFSEAYEYIRWAVQAKESLAPSPPQSMRILGPEQCEQLGDIAWKATEARDNGTPLLKVLQTLHAQNALDPQTAHAVRRAYSFTSHAPYFMKQHIKASCLEKLKTQNK